MTEQVLEATTAHVLSDKICLILDSIFFEPNTTYLLGRGVAILSNKMSCKLRCEKLPTKIHSCWNFDGVFFSDFHWTNSCCIHGRLASWCLGKTLGFGSETIQKKALLQNPGRQRPFPESSLFRHGPRAPWSDVCVRFWWWMGGILRFKACSGDGGFLMIFASGIRKWHHFFVVKAGTSNVEVL